MLKQSSRLSSAMGDSNPFEWRDTGSLRIGIDIGGTGIKAGIVDTDTGVLVGPALQIPTPRPATPAAVSLAVAELVDELVLGACAPPVGTPVGVALPAIVQRGVARSAANIDPGWIGLDVCRFFAASLERGVCVLNDGDAAGMAEVTYGAGKDVAGKILLITLGTGIGSALFFDGQLVPNIEFGHLELDAVVAETKASAVARERDGLDWTAYGDRLQRYFSHLDFLISPDLIVVGGGISACSEEFIPRLRLDARVVPAQLENAAGIVGAALQARALCVV